MTEADTADLSFLFSGSDEAESITVSPAYVREKLAYIDSLEVHIDEGGGISTVNIQDVISFARQFAKGYAQHANILKAVIADRDRVMASRNAANEELYRLRRQPRIVTSHVYPPVPDRSHDWCAHYEGEEEAGGYGYGRTEAEAIADFKENYQADHDERIA